MGKYTTTMTVAEMIIHALQNATEEVKSTLAATCVINEMDGSGGDGVNFAVSKGDDVHHPCVTFRPTAIGDDDDDTNHIFDFQFSGALGLVFRTFWLHMTVSFAARDFCHCA